jgi:uncharacterized membrane protein
MAYSTLVLEGRTHDLDRDYTAIWRYTNSLKNRPTVQAVYFGRDKTTGLESMGFSFFTKNEASAKRVVEGLVESIHLRSSIVPKVETRAA